MPDDPAEAGRTILRAIAICGHWYLGQLGESSTWSRGVVPQSALHKQRRSAGDSSSIFITKAFCGSRRSEETLFQHSNIPTCPWTLMQHC